MPYHDVPFLAKEDVTVVSVGDVLEAISRFMVARKRQSPLFIAAKISWEGVLDVLPPKAAGTLKRSLSPDAQRVMGQMNRTGDRGSRQLGR